MASQHYGLPRRNRPYGLDYIADRTVYAAVMFALKMMHQGTPPAIANSRAADYYGVAVQDVAHYTGQAGGRSARRKR
ncbi:MAG TPA: hypothetical protein VH682_24980 [Gemmataceae bacterium]